MTFQMFYDKYQWRPIRGCPGRYTLKSSEWEKFNRVYSHFSQIEEFHSPHSADRILVLKLEDGGLISYKKEDGLLIHTLGNSEGFNRKLEMLGL